MGSRRVVGDKGWAGVRGLRLLFFPSLVVTLQRTWHIAGLYVILCFPVCHHAYVERAVCSGRVAAYWMGVTLGKNELALYYYAN